MIGAKNIPIDSACLSPILFGISSPKKIMARVMRIEMIATDFAKCSAASCPTKILPITVEMFMNTTKRKIDRAIDCFTRRSASPPRFFCEASTRARESETVNNEASSMAKNPVIKTISAPSIINFILCK